MNYILPSWKILAIARSSQHNNDIQQSSQHILDELKIDIKVDGELPDTQEGILIISNHTSTLDLFTLYSFLPTDKLYFIGAYINGILGKVWQERILPVFFSYRPISEPIDVFRQFFWKYHEPSTSREDSQTRNRDSIATAAKLLRTGNRVILFPGGKKLQASHSWAKGVGHLVSQTKMEKLIVVFVYISASSLENMFRQYLPKLLFWLMPNATIKVVIKKPVILTTQQMTMSPEEITGFLEHEYYKKER